MDLPEGKPDHVIPYESRLSPLLDGLEQFGKFVVDANLPETLL